MIVAMQELATDEQIQDVVEHLIRMGFSVHRTTGERQTILAAVGARTDFDTRNLEVLAGVETLDEQILFDPHSHDSELGSWSVVKQLRASSPDAVVLLTKAIVELASIGGYWSAPPQPPNAGTQTSPPLLLIDCDATLAYDLEFF